ncbi:hypothetical protein HQN90_10545 [Paenibacillus alba]|nr:hypothetical protein [Paenibacillus alba]
MEIWTYWLIGLGIATVASSWDNSLIHAARYNAYCLVGSYFSENYCSNDNFSGN